MAILSLTHAPILSSNAQVLILPVNSAGVLLDPVLGRCKTLFPDNYQRYYRACRDSTLHAGSCLLHKRQRELTGLGVAHNGHQPNYIANLVISDHPYHPTRTRWLNEALVDLQQQLIPLIRYQGIRRAALLARPLLSDTISNKEASASTSNINSIDNASALPLDWQTVVLPLITQHLQGLSKLRIDVHMPKLPNI